MPLKPDLTGYPCICSLCRLHRLCHCFSDGSVAWDEFGNEVVWQWLCATCAAQRVPEWANLMNLTAEQPQLIGRKAACAACATEAPCAHYYTLNGSAADLLCFTCALETVPALVEFCRNQELSALKSNHEAVRIERDEFTRRCRVLESEKASLGRDLNTFKDQWTQARGELQAALDGTHQELNAKKADLAIASTRVGAMSGTHEIEHEDVDPLTLYHAVLKMNRFTDVYDRTADKGWQVKCRQGFVLNAWKRAVIVVPFGRFNSGKSWLLAKLCGQKLPSGNNVHTEGISICETESEGRPLLLLDTVGADSPVDFKARHLVQAARTACVSRRGLVAAAPLAAGLVEGSAAGSATALDPEARSKAEAERVETRVFPEEVDYMLQEVRRQEDFLRQSCFKLGTVILLVIGQMSHKDQTDLVLLERAIRKERCSKVIVVVHNLKGWDRRKLMKKDPETGLNYMERNARLFGLHPQDGMKVTLGGTDQWVERHEGLFGGIDAKSGAGGKIWHFYLTDEHLDQKPTDEKKPSEPHFNDFVIQAIKRVIGDCQNKEFVLSDSLASVANELQGRFVKFQSKLPNIIFETQPTPRFVVDADLPSGEWSAKDLHIDSYFAVDTEEVHYNITTVFCSVKVRNDLEEEDKSDEEETPPEYERRSAHLLQLELPGLREEDVRRLKKLSRSGQLVQELSDPQDPKGPKFAVLELAGKLSNVSATLAADVESYFKGAIRLGDGPQEISDDGTRAQFKNGYRDLRMTLRTSISDWDTSIGAIVSYGNGILSVVLVRKAGCA